jgi:hypothetical protein
MTRQASNSRASVRPSDLFQYQHIVLPGTSLNLIAITATATAKTAVILSQASWQPAKSLSEDVAIRDGVPSVSIGDDVT